MTLIGKAPAIIIGDHIEHLEKEVQKQRTASSQADNGFQPYLSFAHKFEVCIKSYRTEMRPLLQLFKENGYVSLPPQSENSGTSLSGTQQYPSKFPEDKRRNLKWLAEILGCPSVTAVDRKGWNLFHHLFHTLPSSDLALDIAAKVGQSTAEMPAGDVRLAMQQKTKGLFLQHQTPVHILCTNSDGLYKKKEIIKMLLERNILKITDFDQRNDVVIVFF